jgi:hypothetical protein
MTRLAIFISSFKNDPKFCHHQKQFEVVSLIRLNVSRLDSADLKHVCTTGLHCAEPYRILPQMMKQQTWALWAVFEILLTAVFQNHSSSKKFVKFLNNRNKKLYNMKLPSNILSIAALVAISINFSPTVLAQNQFIGQTSELALGGENTSNTSSVTEAVALNATSDRDSFARVTAQIADSPAALASPAADPASTNFISNTINIVPIISLPSTFTEGPSSTVVSSAPISSQPASLSHLDSSLSNFDSSSSSSSPPPPQKLQSISSQKMAVSVPPLTAAKEQPPTSSKAHLPAANLVATSPPESQAIASVGGSDSSLTDPQGTTISNPSSGISSNVQVENAPASSSSAASSSNSGSPVVAIVCSVLAVGLVCGLGFIGYSRYSRNSGNIMSFAELGKVLSEKRKKHDDESVQSTSKDMPLDQHLPTLAPIHPQELAFPFHEEMFKQSGHQTYSHNLHASMYSAIILDKDNHASMVSSNVTDLEHEFHNNATAAYYGPSSQNSQSTTANIFGESNLIGMINESSNKSPAAPASQTVDPYAVAAASLKAASQDSQESCHKFDSLMFDVDGVLGEEFQDFISTSDLFFE